MPVGCCGRDKDTQGDFAWGGFVIGTVALILSLPSGFGYIYAFGLVFGPLMAMFFRVIAGDWCGGHVTGR